jgi:hypothetical protein
MWGQSRDNRDKLLADIHRIDPQAAITRVDVTDMPFAGALQSAHAALEGMPGWPQRDSLADSCFQMFSSAGWVLPEELAALTNRLAGQAPSAYEVFLEALKPPTCRKPAP